MKVTKIILGFVISLSIGYLAASPSESEIKQVSDLIVVGKLSDMSIEINPLILNMKIRRVGDMGTWNSKEGDLTLNRLYITDGRILLVSFHSDTMGCEPLRHVPALPDLENILKINTEAEMIKVLGIPLGGLKEGSFLNWGFFSLDDKKLRIVTIRALRDESDKTGKLRSVEIQTGTK